MMSFYFINLHFWSISYNTTAFPLSAPSNTINKGKCQNKWEKHYIYEQVERDLDKG